MCQSTIHQHLATLPKCEHHLHIEGSLSPELEFRLAQKNNIILPAPGSGAEKEDAAFTSVATLNERYENFTDLNDFLHYYYLGMSVLLHESDFEDLAYEYFKKAHADGVVHAEIFFDPQAHTSRGIPYKTVVTGFTKGQTRAEKDFGLTSKLILCFLRHLPASEANITYAEADALGHFSDGTVAGIGLDSSEVGFPPEIFREVYEKAQATGLRRTAHAGEEGDSTYISRALDICKTERIDHGIRLIQDQALLERVAREKILITMCPLSNVRLRCVKHVSELPIRKFLDEGIQFSINSDDPAYFGGYILDNYCAVHESFKLSFEEWKGIALASINGSWCDEARKQAVRELIEKWYATTQ